MGDLPSVTRILDALRLRRYYPPSPDSQRYMDLGTALDRALTWHAEGTLDEASLHPEVRPGFEAYLKFLRDTGHVPEASQLALEHPWGFVGHLDRVGTLNGTGPVIIDFKYSDSPDLKGTRYQLAGYRILWDHHYPDRPAQGCYLLALGKDGRPSLSEDLMDIDADQVFKAALIVYQAQQRLR